MKQLIQCMGMLMLLFALSSRVSAQITLVKDGKATSRIVLVEKNEVNEQAATLLQDFVKRISQATLPIVADTKARSGDILIGGKQASAGEDGFLLKTTANEQLQISSGGDKGIHQTCRQKWNRLPSRLSQWKRYLPSARQEQR